MAIDINKLDAKKTYSDLQGKSSDFMTLAVSCSELTIPNFVYDGDDVPISTDNGLFTSAGTKGLEELISNLMITLFPPGKSFYYLTPNQEISTEVSQLTAENGKSLLEKDLMMPISYTSRLFDSMRLREDIHSALKVAAMGGGSLLKIDFENTEKSKHYTLNNYRCTTNELTKQIEEFVIREKINYSSLDSEILKELNVDEEQMNKEAELYTHCKFDATEKKYIVYQQIDEIKIKDSQVEYDQDTLPYIHIVINKVYGSSYGFGLVYSTYADLKNLNETSKSLVDHSIQNSMTRYFLDPTGQTRLQDVLNSKNGDIIRGRASDLTGMQPTATTQSVTTMNFVQYLEQKISKYFMSKQVDYGNRDRVTSTEILNNASSIDSGMGGLYSSISPQIQLPLAKLLLKHSGAEKGLFDETDIKIITGLEAINQGKEATSLMSFINAMAVMAQYKPDAFAAIDLNEYTKRVAVANQIDPTGLIISQQEMQQRQIQEQQQQLAMQGAQGAVDNALQADAQAIQQQQQQNPQ